MQESPHPPIPRHFTRTIAERQWVCRENGKEQPLCVEWGEPVQDVVVINGMDWRCPLRITLGEQVTLRSVPGIDSLQALQLALQVARTELETLARRPGTLLVYLGEVINTAEPGWRMRLL